MDTSPPPNARPMRSRPLPAATTGWWARWRQVLPTTTAPAAGDDAADHGTAFGLDMSFSQRRDPDVPPER
ncbi:hypothetical protein [Caldimonas sp. KR1-144]|uniref:hypothetical protein n=1 Tax=Caldimonas sp. KR1-144 TaxID=3400911 RepID=UPI003C099D11